MLEMYEQVVIARTGIETAQRALHLAVDGYGLSFPSNGQDYLARVHLWLVEAENILEAELTQKGEQPCPSSAYPTETA